MRSVFFIILLFLYSLVQAQKHDNYWISGYEGWSVGPVGDSVGITALTFSDSNVAMVVNREPVFINFDIAKGIICDSIGKPQLFCNNNNIYNNFGEIVDDGGDLSDQNCEGGCRDPQGTIILPVPNTNHRYWVISTERDYIGAGGWIIYSHLYANLVDMNTNNGHSKAIIRKQLLLNDTLDNGKITAVKHANGRDWWLWAIKDRTNTYFRFLIDPNGIHNMGTTTAGIPKYAGLGFAAFSPDGTKYVRLDDVNVLQPGQLLFYDFDRCLGELTYIGVDSTYNPKFAGGLAFSHDSRYLWLTKVDGLYQYDLHDPNFLETEVFVTPYPTPLSNSLHFAQLGPDGRIYLNLGRSMLNVPYINNPHLAGAAADFRYDDLILDTYSDYCTPNMPWFRLGPVDGSVCDTLGLDNHPLCNWRWEVPQPTIDPLTIAFTDLTTYEPLYWQWYFGDGTTSSERYPTHTYDSAGTYTVCLIVSNNNSNDTLCQVLNLGMVSTTYPVAPAPAACTVYPNPANTRLYYNLNVEIPHDARFQLLDLNGRIVSEAIIPVRTQSGSVALDGLSEGVYVFRVIGLDGTLAYGRVAIVR
jgi:hypothetical protein